VGEGVNAGEAVAGAGEDGGVDDMVGRVGGTVGEPLEGAGPNVDGAGAAQEAATTSASPTSASRPLRDGSIAMVPFGTVRQRQAGRAGLTPRRHVL
jgi:hypothetical protein